MRTSNYENGDSHRSHRAGRNFLFLFARRRLGNAIAEWKGGCSSYGHQSSQRVPASPWMLRGTNPNQRRLRRPTSRIRPSYQYAFVGFNAKATGGLLRWPCSALRAKSLKVSIRATQDPRKILRGKACEIKKCLLRIMLSTNEYPLGHPLLPVVGRIPQQTERKKPGNDGQCGKPSFSECCFIPRNRHQAPNRQTDTSHLARALFARILPAAFHNATSSLSRIHISTRHAPPASSRSIRPSPCLPGHLSPPSFRLVGLRHSTIPSEYPSIIVTIKIKAEYERCLVIPEETKAL